MNKPDPQIVKMRQELEYYRTGLPPKPETSPQQKSPYHKNLKNHPIEVENMDSSLTKELNYQSHDQ